MKMFQGVSGKTSIMRVLTAVIVGTAMLLWTVANIKCWCTGCQWIAPDVQTVTLVLGALAAKAGQRFGEKVTVSTDAVPADKTE